LNQPDVQHRASWIAGYLNLYDRRFDAFTAAPVISRRYLQAYRAVLGDPTPARLAELGAGIILTREQLPSPFAEEAQGAGGVRVYRYPHALPMAAHFAPNPLTARHGVWSVDTSSAVIRIDAPRAGIVVLRQQNAPGWTVTVDGKDAQRLVVDDMFRAVDVGPGQHEIIWRYRPLSLIVGAVVTALTLLSLQIGFFVKR
jgi:hypothetical protein